MNGSVTSAVSNGIARVAFSYPPHNSMPASLLSELTKALRQAGGNAAVRVIVMASEGERTFCAGADVDELAAIRDVNSGEAFFSGFAHVLNAMRQCPQLIVGRIQGRAIGGGVGLAAATDYAVATQYASVKLSELSIGIGPFVIAPVVERKMGLSAFSELAINATEWRTAAWAKSKGLFHEVFDTVEQTDAYIASLAERLAQSSPEAMRALKKMLWSGTDHWDALLGERARISGRLAATDFARRAISALKQK